MLYEPDLVEMGLKTTLNRYITLRASESSILFFQQPAHAPLVTLLDHFEKRLDAPDPSFETSNLVLRRLDLLLLVGNLEVRSHQQPALLLALFPQR